MTYETSIGRVRATAGLGTKLDLSPIKKVG